MLAQMPKKGNPPNEVFTYKEAAAFLGIKVSTLKVQLRRKKLTAEPLPRRIGRQTMGIRRMELQRYEQSRAEEAAKRNARFLAARDAGLAIYRALHRERQAQQ